MRRRVFMVLLSGAAVVWPRAVVAQSTDRLRRVSVLMGHGTSDPKVQRQIVAFEQALKEIGWGKGRNVRIDYRFPAGDTKLALALARELVGLAPDVLVGQGISGLAALQQVTHAIPIVFVLVDDPLSQYIVAILAQSGGNITGFTNFEFGMAGKWLEILNEVASRLSRVALVFGPEAASFIPLFLHSLEAAARSLAIEVTAFPVRDDAEIERAIAAFGREPNGGLIVVPNAFTTTHRELIIKLAVRYHLPAVYPYTYFASSGGLMSYGADPVDLYRRAASYVDRILKGAKPGELPVQGPTKFELVINLKTARALGVTVPLSLVIRADEMIDE